MLVIWSVNCSSCLKDFEIDPKWYGELPRTYFLDAAHQRTGVSGVLSKEDYETMFTRILN
jgi:hypothetical protein